MPLPRRNHHRKPAARYSHLAPHPGRSVIDAAALNHATQILAIVWRRPASTCHACGVEIRPGQTAFLITDSQSFIYRTCWACGEAIKLHLGWTTPETSPDTLPDAAAPAD